jgi:hypothetical protein
MAKENAHDIIHTRFKEEYGWHDSLDELDGAGRPRFAKRMGFCAEEFA